MIATEGTRTAKAAVRATCLLSDTCWDTHDKIIEVAQEIANFSLTFQRRKFRAREGTKTF
jgi:hypothetical protein